MVLSIYSRLNTRCERVQVYGFAEGLHIFSVLWLTDHQPISHGYRSSLSKALKKNRKLGSLSDKELGERIRIGRINIKYDNDEITALSLLILKKMERGKWKKWEDQLLSGLSSDDIRQLSYYKQVNPTQVSMEMHIRHLLSLKVTFLIQKGKMEEVKQIRDHLSLKKSLSEYISSQE